MNRKNVQIRVMIVDDHPIVRTGLAALIGMEPQMAVVARAANGEEAVELYREHQPDVTVMDLSLPKINGVEAIKRICAEHRKARFVVLTTYAGDEDIYRALKAGAQGYLLKGMFDQELLDAIKNVYAGRRHIPAVIEQQLAGRPSNLEMTARESQILALIVTGRSNQEIAALLGIGEGTVKWFVNQIYGKLDARDRAQAVAIALKRGLVHL